MRQRGDASRPPRQQFDEQGGVRTQRLRSAGALLLLILAFAIVFGNADVSHAQVVVCTPPPGGGTESFGITPGPTTNPVLTPHTVTVTKTCNGQPQPGATVTFTVTPTGSTPTPAAGACVTGPSGQCTFTYTSATAGNDVIRATTLFTITSSPVIVDVFTTKTWTGVVMPCPPDTDEDNDGLTDHNENLLSTLLGNADSDLDGIADGNDDANGNGEDDEDEDDDEDDGCPDADSDGDGEDDEDEDD